MDKAGSGEAQAEGPSTREGVLSVKIVFVERERKGPQAETVTFQHRKSGFPVVEALNVEGDGGK